MAKGKGIAKKSSKIYMEKNDDMEKEITIHHF